MRYDYTRAPRLTASGLTTAALLIVVLAMAASLRMPASTPATGRAPVASTHGMPRG
jgi:hypothetical protein